MKDDDDQIWRLCVVVGCIIACVILLCICVYDRYYRMGWTTWSDNLW